MIFSIIYRRNPTDDYPSSYLHHPVKERGTTHNQPWVSDEAFCSACYHSNGPQFSILYCAVIRVCNFLLQDLQFNFKLNEEIKFWIFCSNIMQALKNMHFSINHFFSWKMIFFLCNIFYHVNRRFGFLHRIYLKKMIMVSSRQNYCSVMTLVFANYPVHCTRRMLRLNQIHVNFRKSFDVT